MMAGRRANERGHVGESVLNESQGRLSAHWARHSQELEGVVFPEKVDQGGMRDAVIAHGWRDSDAWC